MFSKAKYEAQYLEIVRAAVKQSGIMAVPIEKFEEDFKKVDTCHYERELGRYDPGYSDGGHYEVVLVIERKQVFDKQYPDGMSEWTAEQLGYPKMTSHLVPQQPYVRLYYSCVPIGDFVAHYSESKRWIFPDLLTLWSWLQKQVEQGR
jgi:hypothetical protein